MTRQILRVPMMTPETNTAFIGIVMPEEKGIIASALGASDHDAARRV